MHDKNGNIQNKDKNMSKTYQRKQKSYNTLFDIPVSENEMQKERQRQKRDMDKRKPKNRKYMYD